MTHGGKCRHAWLGTGGRIPYLLHINIWPHLSLDLEPLCGHLMMRMFGLWRVAKLVKGTCGHFKHDFRRLFAMVLVQVVRQQLTLQQSVMLCTCMRKVYVFAGLQISKR